MRTTMPGYPIPRNRSSSHWMNASNIEAVFSQQGDESRRTEGREAHFVATVSHPLDEREGLRALLAQGNQQAAVRRELLHERRWDLRAARGNQNRIVGRVRTPPQSPVAQEHRDVRDPGLAQRLPGSRTSRCSWATGLWGGVRDRKSTRLNSSHPSISYAVFCMKKKNNLHHLSCIYRYFNIERIRRLRPLAHFLPFRPLS